jgi:hypothetical protein
LWSPAKAGDPFSNRKEGNMGRKIAKIVAISLAASVAVPLVGMTARAKLSP